MSRYHLALDAIRSARQLVAGSDRLVSHCEEMLERHASYVVEPLEDAPEIRDWRWSS
jgi:xylulose-5-phosphate/fructose-6-phosphate phosphoketolase